MDTSVVIDTDLNDIPVLETIPKLDLSINTIQFAHPILNASGCWALHEKQLDELYGSKLAGIVSKTATLFSKNGNPEPTYYYDTDNKISYNCKGLPNLGYNYYKMLSTKYSQKPYILSLAYDTFDKLKLILLDYIGDDSTSKKLVELNLSCPNGANVIIGYSLDLMEELFRFLKMLRLSNILFGLKLPPYLDTNSIVECAKLFIKYPDIIAYIVSCNSIPNSMPMLHGKQMLSSGIGGMSGKQNKGIALSNVYNFAIQFKNLKNSSIKIIGCGGIETVDDVLDYLKAGASFVQVASCFYDEIEDKLNTEKINKLVNEFELLKVGNIY
jgi:dihydroorotate dehydrogenase (fumarate)